MHNSLSPTLLPALFLSAGIMLIACQSGTKPAPASKQSETLAKAPEPDTESPAALSGNSRTPEETTSTARTKPLRAETLTVAQTKPGRETGTPVASRPKPPATQPAKPESVVPPPKPVALPKLWDFGADHCIPCRMMLPILEDLAREYAGKVEVRIINVQKEGALASQYRIQLIPTQVFIDPSGREIYRHVGYLSRDSILAKFREFGWK